MPEFRSASFSGLNNNPLSVKNDISAISSVYTTHKNTKPESKKQEDQVKKQHIQSFKDQNFDKFQETNNKQSQNKKNKKSILQELDATYQQRQKRFYFSDSYKYLDQLQENRKKQQREKNELNEQRQRLNATRPKKTLDYFAIKDILQLPMSRQQYLKLLTIQQLKEQPQFKYIFKDSDRVFDIGFYYRQFIDDDDLKEQVIKTYKRKNLISSLSIGLFCGYFFVAPFIDKYWPFKIKFRESYHIFIPITIIVSAVYLDFNNTKKRNIILKDQYSNKQFKKLVQRYLCETQSKERQKIMQRQIQTEERRHRKKWQSKKSSLFY